MEQYGIQLRREYLSDRKDFRRNLQTAVLQVLKSLKNPRQPKIPQEIKTKSSELPTVSLITLTHNRPQFFPLALMNFKGTDYPSSKLEWIIVDDSDEGFGVEEKVPNDDETIRYFHQDTKQTIASKRNFGVSQARHEIIAFMDDDDIYPPRHLLIRLAYMNHYKKKCGYATSIGCFHIGKLISTMNVPPLQYPPECRSSEATLTFKKGFWEERGFCDEDEGDEGRYFLKGRYGECVEIPFRPIIISLLHSNNISNRVKHIGDEPNGCHFGLSDELFQFITSLEVVSESIDNNQKTEDTDNRVEILSSS